MPGTVGFQGQAAAPRYNPGHRHVPPRARRPHPGGLEAGLPCALDFSSSLPAVRPHGLPQAQFQQPGVWNDREGSCCPLEARRPAEAGHGEGSSDTHVQERRFHLLSLQASAHVLPKRSLSSITSTVFKERNSAHFCLDDANS